MARRAEPPRLTKESNGNYYVRWHDGRRSRKESLATKEAKEAQKRFAIWLMEEERGVTDEYTVDDLLGFYLDEHVPTLTDQQRATERIQLVRRHFGELPVDGVTPRSVGEYIRCRPVTPGTIRSELQMLVAAMNHNLKHRRITHVPHIELPPAGAPRDRWLTAREIEKLLATAKARRDADGRISRVERFMMIALETGSRRRAIELLTWDRVDLDNDQIDFRIPGKALTKKRQAVVPISDRLKPVLDLAWTQRTSDYVLDSSGAIRKTFETTVSMAGLDGVTAHVLRHTAATHMARNGVPLWLVAGVLGNSVQMVEKTYAHHSPDGLKKAVNNVR